MLKDAEAGLSRVPSPPRPSSESLIGASHTRYYILILSFVVGL
jgi:hypothetical protein